MIEILPGYEEWKEEVDRVLDDLVAKNFERLYNGSDSGEHSAWREISMELYKRYGLLDLSHNDPDYELKQQKHHHISVSMEIYIMEEFPYELHDPTVYGFVQRYGRLPRRLPEEWADFTKDLRREAEERAIDSHRRVMEAIRRYKGEAAVNV